MHLNGHLDSWLFTFMSDSKRKSQGDDSRRKKKYRSVRMFQCIL